MFFVFVYLRNYFLLGGGGVFSGNESDRGNNKSREFVCFVLRFIQMEPVKMHVLSLLTFTVLPTKTSQ